MVAAAFDNSPRPQCCGNEKQDDQGVLHPVLLSDKGVGVQGPVMVQDEEKVIDAKSRLRLLSFTQPVIRDQH